VEMTCNRVIIINKGKIVASDTPENLTKMVEGGGTVRAEIRGDRPSVERVLRGLPGVKEVAIEPASDDFLRATIYAPPRSDVRVHVFEAATANRWTLRELSRVRQTLEDVFAFITTKEASVKEEEGK